MTEPGLDIRTEEGGGGKVETDWLSENTKWNLKLGTSGKTIERKKKSFDEIYLMLHGMAQEGSIYQKLGQRVDIHCTGLEKHT